MDTPCPRSEDDLSGIERRLSAWQPATDDLHADAMLFAAGQAAGRRNRAALLWPAACVLLALQVVGLGLWGLREHTECQALASRLAERGAPASAASTSVAAMPEPSYTPSPNDYFHLRQRVELDPGRELAFLQPQRSQSPGPPQPGSAIFTAGQRNLIEQ
jgi:hypothetical protein